ncbi:phosphoribosylformylglycinamidine cyclo-ligase [soil metagenome]
MAKRSNIQDVNIELGDDVSRMLYEASKLTHVNRPGLLKEFHESFTGLRAIPLGRIAAGNAIDDLYVNMDFDGIGTKVEVSERLQDHSTIAHDLFAMVCDDAVVRGAESVALGSILDVRQLEDKEETRRAVGELAHGYVEAARLAGVVVVNGEVAELGDRVGGHGDFNYNWGATVLWVAHRERVLSGHQIQSSDTVIGLQEHGFRSNGITDVRKAMLEKYGPNWHNEVIDELGDETLGKQVQRPSAIFSGFVTDLTGGYDLAREPKAAVHGVAHITGGGQPSKLGRMLEPSGLGIEIDTPLKAPRIMLEAQRIRGFNDTKAYGKWHMGPGMVIVTPEPEAILAEAQAQGIDAARIGSISDKPGIQIKNVGSEQKEEWLTF